MKFSLTDFLYRKAYGKLSNDRGKAEVEAMDEAIGKRAPYEFDNSFSMRAMTAGTNSEGGYTVDDKVVDDSIFDNFYQDSYFLSNSTILDNLKSNIYVTSKSTPISISTGGVSETTTAANTLTTEPAFSKILLKPHHIRVSIDVSATLLEQTSHGIDRLIFRDLQGALSEELDRQIFKGVSTDNEINSIANSTGISSDTWGAISSLANSAATSKTIASEKSLGDAKVTTPYNWLLNSETRAKLRTLRVQGLAFPLFNVDNKMLGYDAFITENLDDADCWLINPQYVVLGMWGPRDIIDLIVDGHTKFNSGIVTLTASLMADSALLKPKALSAISES